MNLNVGEILNGFRLKNVSDVAEISAKTYEFEHVKTGAKLFYAAVDDDNKVFYIGFRTPPKDDTGVAHIVEHSVLCGSKKYPLKEPFVELVKGSLNTFLNAMTYPDKTVYPVAAATPKTSATCRTFTSTRCLIPTCSRRLKSLCRKAGTMK